MFEISLKEKVVWVTGGSRGIGKSVCRSFAAAGANVVVSYRQSEGEAVKLAEEISATGAGAMAVQVDVADAESVDQAYSKIESKFDSVDVLVNSAGVTADNLLLMSSELEWQKVLTTNVMGCMRTSKCVIKGMMGKRWGRIINLSSVAASKGGRGQSNYAASKAAIEGMSRSLATEIGRRGITVNCLAPGVVETDMSKEVIALAKDQILERQVIKRFATPDEVAAWAVFIASDFAGFMTGEVIHVDGGMKMP